MLTIFIPILLALGRALVCPPLCVGSNRSSVFLAVGPDVISFKGRILNGVPTSRITGAGAEVDHAVQVFEVYKGGVFLKRVGKNVVHVFSGLGLEPGSECSVDLVEGETYLLSGSARRGSSATQTAQIDINQCTLAVKWDRLSADEVSGRTVQSHCTTS